MKLITAIIIFLSLNACRTQPQQQAEKFEVSLRSPSISIGEYDMQFNRSIAIGIRRNTVNVLYFPLEDAVCLQFRLEGITYHQFWSFEGREAFRKAFEAYNADFDARSFGRSSRRTKSHYGTAKGFIIWQAFNFTIEASAETNIEFGYFFIDRMPYFIVNQREAFFFHPHYSSSNRRLTETPIYFTRAQAAALLEVFEQGFLDSLETGR